MAIWYYNNKKLRAKVEFNNNKQRNVWLIVAGLIILVLGIMLKTTEDLPVNARALAIGSVALLFLLWRAIGPTILEALGVGKNRDY